MPHTDARVCAEIDKQAVEANLTQVNGRWVLTMQRTLRHPRERVWPYLTEPRLLGTWSPIVPDRALTGVGPALSRETPEQEPVDAEVLVSQPPSELVHRWDGQLMRWTLAPTPTGSQLTLEHTFDKRVENASYGAGWHVCLAVLTALLDGQDVERVVGQRAVDYGWAKLRDRYAANTNKRASTPGVPS